MCKRVADLGDVVIQKRCFSIVDTRVRAFAMPLSILLRLSIVDVGLDQNIDQTHPSPRRNQILQVGHHQGAR
jgi:hypothetical protein